MVYIASGILAFSVIHLFDVISLKRIPVVKILTWIIGSGLLVYSVIMASLWPDRLLLPLWTTCLGCVLLLMSLFLLVYSLFINLPFRKTYVDTGVGDRLIKTGLYALVRHPGVHWFVVLMLSLVLASGSKLLLIASPIWISIDILLVFLQDRYFLNRMFEGYDRYRQETPMLLPNKGSVSACIRTISQSRDWLFWLKEVKQ